MSANKQMDPAVKAAWIAFAAAIIAALIAGVFGVIKFTDPSPPTPISSEVQHIPTPTLTSTSMWGLTISPYISGSPSNQLGRYNTSVIAHVVNHATDGSTHDVIASTFSLYPMVNGTIMRSLSETLVFPNSNTDYQIYHSTSMDISLTFSVPCTRSKFALYLANADMYWTYSVMPPSYCSSYS